MKNKPKLVSVEAPQQSGLGTVSWEKRRKMSAEQLIKLMGDKHVSHPAYKARPRSLLPMPNLAGKQPVVSHFDAGLRGHVRELIAWILR